MVPGPITGTKGHVQGKKIFCATDSNPRRLTSCVAFLRPHLHSTCDSAVLVLVGVLNWY